MEDKTLLQEDSKCENQNLRKQIKVEINKSQINAEAFVYFFFGALGILIAFRFVSLFSRLKRVNQEPLWI